MECVGHVQKRAGNHLSKWKKNTNAAYIHLEDDKGPAGVGRLIDATIDR